ncbi:DUF1491 family protein [Salinarimonas ramus]|uniref:DUF1491 family protein n=1 Tax=Salinarimonas ramus TaxID=690164 RepID=A0A917Q8P0_9HYPH|nr:DUF1491 family protein [Salinarimonas ramus]GGK36331.1 hypothetical protein GCM10011322_24130 [Salinarimonas ramus]
MRLTSDFVVSALIRQAGVALVPAMLRRRGAAEAGAIFVKVDRLDGTADLYGPAPQSLVDEEATGERLFSPLLEGATPLDVEERMIKEIRFDPDLWLVEIEDREGRPFVPLARDAG